MNKKDLQLLEHFQRTFNGTLNNWRPNTDDEPRTGITLTDDPAKNGAALVTYLSKRKHWISCTECHIQKWNPIRDHDFKYTCYCRISQDHQGICYRCSKLIARQQQKRKRQNKRKKIRPNGTKVYAKWQKGEEGLNAII